MIRAAAGTTTRTTASSVFGTTTTPTTGTTILASVWQVQKLTFMSIFEREFLLGKNVAAADRMSVVLHSIEFFIRKTRSAQMYKDVHL
ncbi:hypothetical protein DWB79_09080 [Treponema medium]|uniref:Uncharacterized protein n=2 Tax=Treponema medium TaxID=58231 RepID=A0AA87NQD8_TREMD|nr:hypothetical protein [Treponema medium]EPF28102.1 hypothetical protein HMPREF9195_01793 [Treponema medium ATCC 700293]QSH97896.1 hypothetical protein DWB79_09080 [Treponema medium]